MNRRRKCPHANIAECPLYHAMHGAGVGTSCFSDKLDMGLCRVDLGASYQSLRMALEISHPLVVAECEWNADIRLRGTLQ